MLYFAYASHMDPEQMARSGTDHTVVGLASLHEYRLSFPMYSNIWEGGVASVQPHHGDQVWGVLYEVSDERLEKLDREYGYRGPDDQHNVADREHVTVELVRPDDGSSPRPLRAWLYMARPSNPSPPSRRYLDAILRGAQHHELPEEYILALRAIEVEEKPGSATG